jgi:hypothetical protein
MSGGRHYKWDSDTVPLWRAGLRGSVMGVFARVVRRAYSVVARLNFIDRAFHLLRVGDDSCCLLARADLSIAVRVHDKL